MSEKFAFLGSPRFWKLFLIGLSAAVEAYSKTNDWKVAVFAGLSIWLGGSVAVGTIDRAGEKIGSSQG